jgi:aquaporin Z
MISALRRHWPEYLMEAAELGAFMVSACLFGALLEHPASPVRQALGDPALRRVLMGLAMGATAVAIIYSPWGKQSGAHFNPSVTLTFLRLGKVRGWDAFFYVLAQFTGGVSGVLACRAVLGQALAHPAVNYVVTVPGPKGVGVAFAAEAAMTFVVMTVILALSNHTRFARFTGFFAGALVATYIAVEAPLSGMSMNAARTFGSALPAGVWTSFWVYLTAPLLGMLAAAELRERLKGARATHCAKLHHQNPKRCIFCQDARRAVSAA